jgi:hypothetical protein
MNHNRAASIGELWKEALPAKSAADELGNGYGALEEVGRRNVFRNVEVSATLRFPFWGRNQENAIAQVVVLNLRNAVVPELFGIGG